MPPAPADTSVLQGLGPGLRYGLLGLPLAFVALPLYVVLPNHYASAYGMPLGLLGAVLLATRLLDALADPWIGRRVDGLFQRSARTAWGVAALAAALLAAAFTALFFPPVRGTAALAGWAAVLLLLAYLAYSVVSVVHQAWGARLGGEASARARVVAWREAAALVGVVMASVLPALAGLGVTSLVFAATLLGGMLALARAPSPQAATAPDGRTARPWQGAAFRRLMGAYVLNGIASAIPATLVLFYIRDRLQAPAWEPVFLASYFLVGALSLPLWVRAVGRIGLVRAWQASMVLSVAAFAGAALLGPGDVLPYLAVCLASGLALGADLALPAALLAGVIRRAGDGGQAEGAYFGWWAFATKMNLALAAGIALPLLELAGYAPGRREPEALDALAWAYALLPCALKLAAAVALQRMVRAGDDDPLPAELSR